MTIRVHEIAKELGLDSTTVLARLAESGELHKSASSVISPGAVRRLRATNTAPPAPERPVLPRPAPLPAKSNKPVIYKGELRALERSFLDLMIVPRRGQLRNPPAQGRYFITEVERARGLAEQWRECILVMRPDEIVAWSQVADPYRFPPEVAIELHLKGVQPNEVGWHYDDKGEGTLADRVVSGHWTTEQVLTQVEWRRQQASRAG